MTSEPPSTRPVDTAPQLRVAAFRFAWVYFVLYALPWPFGELPGTGVVAVHWSSARDAAIQWFGNDVLGISRSLAPFMTGSGDTTRDYVAWLLGIVAALTIATAWSWLDVRVSHPRLGVVLRGYLRYVLAAAMLGYGVAKFGEGQFAALQAYHLTSTWGDTSPMGVVWRFMGASPAYTAFTGLVECSAGVLLLWRRTATLGGLVAAGAMTNVVMLNFCYDVPVKLYSSHLLAMALVVVAHDLPRLATPLGLRRPVPPPVVPVGSVTGAAVTPAQRTVHALGLVIEVVIAGWMLFGPAMALWRQLQPAHLSEFAGGYEIVADAATTLPGWKHAFWFDRSRFGGGHSLAVRSDRGEFVMSWQLVVDERARTVRIETAPTAGGSAPRSSAQPLQWDATGRELTLTVEHRGASMPLRLRRLRREDFLLINRGFHWIQEHPFNR